MRIVKGQKGQINIATFMGAIYLIIWFWIFIIMADPFYDLVFPYLDNAADPMFGSFGPVIKLMFQLIPLLLGLMIIAYIYQNAQSRTEYYRG